MSALVLFLLLSGAVVAEADVAERDITSLSDLFAGRRPSMGEVASQQWCLHSAVFPMPAKGGFPILFREDGTVVSDNIPGDTWEWAGFGLQIWWGGSPYLEFLFDPCQDALESLTDFDDLGRPLPGLTLRLKSQPDPWEACPGEYQHAYRPFCCAPQEPGLWDRIVEDLATQPRDELLRRLAGHLDRVRLDEGPARRILSLARARDDRLGDEVVALFHQRAADVLTGSERLDHLLGLGSAEIDHGPGVFEIDPARDETLARFLTRQELAFLDNQPELPERLLRHLEERGSRVAALLLARLGEAGALPELRRWLLTASDTYGHETSYPTMFSEGEHLGYDAYSRAIEHLTGRPLEEAVSLELEEIETLDERASSGDETALMLLYRLAPEVARAKVFEFFRAARAASHCLSEGNTIHRYQWLPPGTTRSEAFSLLGPPDAIVEPFAFYCCVFEDWAGDFRLRLDGDRVLAFESEYRDSDRRDPWCVARPPAD